MGTRFIATTECPAHDNVKQAIVEAGEGGTAVVCGTIGAVRSLKTPLMERCAEMERNGSGPKEITDLYHSGYLKGMLEGNATDGTLICGSGCCLVKEVKTAGQVVRDVTREAEDILAGL
jgi:enoyl-[acyl-carrier protein] reductase II